VVGRSRQRTVVAEVAAVVGLGTGGRGEVAVAGHHQAWHRAAVQFEGSSQVQYRRPVVTGIGRALGRGQRQRRRGRHVHRLVGAAGRRRRDAVTVGVGLRGRVARRVGQRDAGGEAQRRPERKMDAHHGPLA